MIGGEDQISRKGEAEAKQFTEAGPSRLFPCKGARVFPEAQPLEWAALALARRRGWAITRRHVGWPADRLRRAEGWRGRDRGNQETLGCTVRTRPRARTSSHEGR